MTNFIFHRRPTINESKKRSSLLWALIYLLSMGLLAPSLHAAFEETDTGARPAALGGAYIALGDDTFSLFYNPAGLSRLRQREVVSEYSRLFTGLSDGSNISQYALAASYPVKSAGTVAFGWKELSLDNLYSERTLSLGYGQWLTQRIAAGLTLKQLHHAFNSPGSVVDDNGNIQNGTPSLFSDNGTSEGSLSVNLGLLVRLTDRQFLGYSVRDLNEPNVALDRADSDIVPRTHGFGWAYQGAKHFSLTTALTTRQCPCDTRDYTVAAGGEKWWSFSGLGDFTTRGSLALGTQEYRQFGLGFSFRRGLFQLDYAFIFDLGGISLGDTAGTHRFSLFYRFDTEPTPAITPTGEPIQDLPVNILRVPTGTSTSFSLEQDSDTVPEPALKNNNDPLTPEKETP